MEDIKTISIPNIYGSKAKIKNVKVTEDTIYIDLETQEEAENHRPSIFDYL